LAGRCFELKELPYPVNRPELNDYSRLKDLNMNQIRNYSVPMGVRIPLVLNSYDAASLALAQPLTPYYRMPEITTCSLCTDMLAVGVSAAQRLRPTSLLRRSAKTAPAEKSVSREEKK
jgi:hypothetical protein